MPEASQSGQTQISMVPGLWDTRGLWTMSTRVEFKGMPQPRATGVSSPGKDVAKGHNKNKVNVGNKKSL
jgi:hypothetical protein